MKRFNTAAVVILAALLIACLVAVVLTPEPGAQVASVKSDRLDQPVVDMPLLETANRLAAFAETSNEQDQAAEAQQLADHERDEAFVAALRDAAAYKPPPTGPLHELANTIATLETQFNADQTRVEQLKKQKTPDSDTDQLDLANAQVALDKDELADAQEDLARAGGDPHAAIQREMQQHEATEHQSRNQNHAVHLTETLVQQVQTWFSLGAVRHELQAAEQEVASQMMRLSDRHKEIETQLNPTGATTTTRSIADLQHLSGLRKNLSSLDDRIQDCQQLIAVYKAWGSFVATRRASVLHLLMSSLAQILAILLGSLLVLMAIGRGQAAGRVRSTHTRLIATVGVQSLAILLILLVLFGAPNQVSTIIGLATAAIAVVSKDFIVSFFGWFMLMGKNGIRVGDWVEINGVSGEVLEIGLLKTVLLEVGNWSETGQPTGRQVNFSNSYAMEGHYFNFSTSGQWLWDEIVISLPGNGDPYATALSIATLVERETDSDVAEATKDWETVVNQYGARNFSARPAVNLRPSGGGLEVVVRYITHAPERHETRARLLKMIVELLHKPVAEIPAAAAKT